MANFWNNIVKKMTTKKYTGSEGDIDVNKRFSMSAPTSYRNFQRGDNEMYSGEGSWSSIAGGKEVGKEEELPTHGKTYVPRASSAISKVDYEPSTNTASVTYNGGSKAYDFNVTPDQMKQFIDAPSKGRWVQYVWKKWNRKTV